MFDNVSKYLANYFLARHPVEAFNLFIRHWFSLLNVLLVYGVSLRPALELAASVFRAAFCVNKILVYLYARKSAPN